MNDVLKRFWRWLKEPAPPPGWKKPDNPNLPGLAPTDCTALPNEKILEMQIGVLADKCKDFDRINEQVNRIGKFVFTAFQHDIANGLHGRIGNATGGPADIADIVIYYLRQYAEQQEFKRRNYTAKLKRKKDNEK